ncbi:MAG: hypothetical protein HRT35_21965, partial [Algicola sp.]|nr:hypothetical protein [Algicola sp.]
VKGPPLERAGRVGLPPVLANETKPGTTYINGAFFVAAKTATTDEDEPYGQKAVSSTIGDTSVWDSVVKPPDTWGKYYVKFGTNDNFVTSAPVLSTKGHPTDINFQDKDLRYQYSEVSKELQDKMNKRSGALTHSGDANERAAVGIRQHVEYGKRNFPETLTMHTLTTPGKDRADKLGATMKEWQTITDAAETRMKSTTINLDGGPSVYMGMHLGNSKHQVIARGGLIGDYSVRTIPTIITGHSVKE